MRIRSLAAVALGCLVAAGCGGSSHHPSARATTSHALPAPAISSACPVGNSFMGCAVRAQVGIVPRSFAAPAGPKFVDVSDFQPNVNWRAVKSAGIIGVVIKAGEAFSEDPTFASHLAGARAAGLKVAVYWFERPVGCSAEAAAIDRVVPRGLKVIFDEEVPGLSGYGNCERGPVQSHAGIEPGEYTSPGVLSDRSLLPLWEATFGPTLSVLWRPLIAWQFTDAASVPGIGISDESVNYGLFATAKPQLVRCFGKGAQPSSARCKPVIALDVKRSRALRTTDDALGLHADALFSHRCVKPYRRGVCRVNGRLVAQLTARRRWYTAAINQLVKAYS